MLARLLQLTSPTLPVGAYTYSQGLEWAVESGIAKDEASTLTWIGDQLTWNLGRYEVPLVAGLMAAWQGRDLAAAHALNDEYLASRESAEMRAETLQMGYSLRRLLDDLDEVPEGFHGGLAASAVSQQLTFPYLWSALAVSWHIPVQEALIGWLWSWAENQTMAALKAVPLGQAAGQRILRQIGERIPAVVTQALALPDQQRSNFAPGFAMACAQHETQYSRLFRS